MSPVSRDTSFIEKRSPNLAVQFRDRVAKSPNAEAFRVPAADGQPWTSISWKQAGERVEKLAAGLLSLGIESEQRVGIAAGTRLEWIEADLAVLAAGAATTTVYPSTMAVDVAYILADSGSRVVFAENDEQVQKLRDHKADLPDLFKVVLFDPSTSSGQAADQGDWVITLDELAALGEKFLADNPDAVDKAVSGIKPEQLATLIYTSGTTGKPKGVRLTHSSWTYEGAVVQSQGILDETDLQFLWLPMAHSFGKVLLSAQLACGFATAIDGRVDRIIDNVGIVKPTFMGAAPRIFEKAYARIITMQEAEGGLKEKIFNQAFKVGRQVDALKFAGKSVPLPLQLQHALFDKLVFAKIRDRFGGRVRFFLSGSAALNRDIAEWFHAAGLLILEGYGLTETSAGAFVNHPDDYKIGTVGQVFPGGEVRLGEGDEIQIKGPNIMDGYHNLPDETASTLTEDGWLRTGDKGSLDAEGFLTITGRIKELFKTSGGKYVAPPAIEAKMKALCPYVSQFMVFGNERNYCIALVTLDPDSMAGWAKENGKGGQDYATLVGSPEIKAMMEGYVEQLNGQLNRWETVKKFEILDHDLTIESGELTPSLKVKRNVVEENNKALIDGLYS
ncbi:AMP-dependent synthetase/ligase [Nocardioides marmorisolisilvae]|uniref:Long-chain fatty acid--CoA ligase n=1 Tax=Nocardioides marmorisolisilvae TaxID=1542737 RepID=A0A3N0DTP2_9ACTN|nr:AMP-dependent synthetase/ligase [Nocardioides marmorisolisilvae]RNL78866.1 long-chain fatty acid--CoA ligase [Nocardioides marmorisolisilvae]